MESERWLKVARVDSRGKLMDLTDPNPTPVFYDPDAEGVRRPNYAFNYVQYAADGEGGNPANVKHRHWVDVPVLRVLAMDLAHARKGEKRGEGYEPILQEFKGGRAQAAGIEELGPDGLVARSLTVIYNEGLRIGPVFQFLFDVKEGLAGDKGQISPKPGGRQFLKEFINIGIPHARQFGAAILAYTAAKETVAMWRHYSPE